MVLEFMHFGRQKTKANLQLQ